MMRMITELIEFFFNARIAIELLPSGIQDTGNLSDQRYTDQPGERT